MILRNRRLNKRVQYNITKRSVKNLIDDGCSKVNNNSDNSFLNKFVGQFKERTAGNLVLVRHGT